MNIYWAAMPNEIISPLKFDNPSPAIKHFPKPSGSNVNKCPAMIDYHKNTYALTFPMAYNLTIAQDGEVHTGDYTREILEHLLTIRDQADKLYSLNFNSLFIAEQPCEIEVFTPTTVKNSFVKNTFLVPGTYDIGEWIRPLECAFFVDKEGAQLTINQGDVWAYIRFKTNEPVNLRRFFFTPEMHPLLSDIARSVWPATKNVRKLEVFYHMLRRSGYKKNFMRLVKNNLSCA
jgi:hypothetical protein